MAFLARLRFMIRYRTFRPVVVDPANDARIIVYHGGEEVSLPRRCPHQGAPLEQGSVKGGMLQCPWHGCYYTLDDRKFCPKDFAPRKAA